MNLSSKQIKTIILVVLSENEIDVDQITTHQWIDIIKRKATTRNVNNIKVNDELVSDALNKIVGSNGFYNAKKGKNYIQGEADYGCIPTITSSFFFYS